MKFLDAEFVQGFIRMANDGWEQGWHERNGGNLSYRVKPEEADSVKENFNPGQWQLIGTSVPGLAGEYFLVTGSGKYFRNVIINPEDSICMIETEKRRTSYQRAAFSSDESRSKEAGNRRKIPCDLSCSYNQCDCSDLCSSSV